MRTPPEPSPDLSQDAIDALDDADFDRAMTLLDTFRRAGAVPIISTTTSVPDDRSVHLRWWHSASGVVMSPERGLWPSCRSSGERSLSRHAAVYRPATVPELAERRICLECRRKFGKYAARLEAN